MSILQTLRKHLEGCELDEVRHVVLPGGYDITFSVRNKGGQGATKAPDVLDKEEYTNTSQWGRIEDKPVCLQTLRLGEEKFLRFICVGTELVFRHTRSEDHAQG